VFCSLLWSLWEQGIETSAMDYNMFGIDSFGFDVLAAAACTTSTAKVLVNL
jgi:hypothetical protein